MQISVDVHNYMETLVGQVIGQPRYVETYDHDQLADIACLALVQLKPIYIRHDIDFLAALSSSRLETLRSSVQVAVDNAETMIVEDRRQTRDEELPIIFSHSRYDENNEMEWFEKPILKVNNDN